MPLIATNCINGKDLYPSYETTRFVSAETYKTWFRGHPKPGDILFVCKGSPGRTNWVPDPVDFCIAQDMVAVRANPKKVYPKYLFAVLRSHIVQSQIDNMHVGTMIPHFKKGDFDKLNIPLLDSGSQVAVGDLYFELSQRITLLRETNATLEAIAQALFKSWFVDFDPVRAKMEGRTPEGMDEATAALFPDGFETSELGEVPRGWQPIRLDSFLELAYGKALKAENRKPGLVPVYGSGGVTGWHDTPLIDSPSIIVGRKGTVGSLYWESRPFYPIDTVFYVKAKRPLTYCHQLLKTLGLDGMNTDAAVPGLNRENVYRLLVPDVPAEMLAAFDTSASALRDSIDHNEAQAQTLSVLRDTLLPRLISGQLRLSEAQAAAEAALGGALQA
ncbi:restriction endonuclease subunit S [Acidovorax sp.]|uniref:restriction endonuclease subunit S n=1 Tax=Acidovorax sp. TaxID=1872122 RepID=UPI0025BF3D0E|nr:restriction endonuclease subunit S [Acidovorax sp.]MBW8464169.1 restriction endonuclease subunit S [Acidovorax sp.]